MSVTDSLVGRVIGLGGNKINSITVSSFICYQLIYHRYVRRGRAELKSPCPADSQDHLKIVL